MNIYRRLPSTVDVPLLRRVTHEIAYLMLHVWLSVAVTVAWMYLLWGM